MTLKNGVIKDAHDRIGYISESYQFQFDGPPQAGSLFTAGFSVCSNGSLALGSSSVFHQCKSGDFYNLYDRDWAEQCEPVEFGIIPCGDDVQAAPKRRVVGSSIVATTVVTVVSEGVTKEVPTTIAVPMCQIGDGQVQVRTTPCDDMELPIITAPPISQISDGQIQVPTTAPPAPAPRPQGVPSDDTSEDAPKDTPTDTSTDTPKADKPTDDSGKDVPDTDGDKPADKGDHKEGDEGSFTPAGDKPTESDSSLDGGDDEVLVTDTSAALVKPSATTTSGSDSSKVVKPFRTQSATDSDESEEISSNDDASEDNDAAPAATEVPVSHGFHILPGASFALMVGGLGALMFL